MTDDVFAVLSARDVRFSEAIQPVAGEFLICDDTVFVVSDFTSGCSGCHFLQVGQSCPAWGCSRHVFIKMQYDDV